MFDIGWSELLVIGVVALIVVGPKDLPQMFRALGRFTAKAKSMAREFTRAMEEAADEAGVKDVADDLKNATSARSLGLNKIEEAVSSFEKWDPMAREATPATGQEAAPTAPAPGEAPSGAASAAKASPKKPAKKPAAKAASKPAAKPAAKKPAAKPAKKPAAKKPAAKPAKKSVARKPAKKPTRGS